MPQIFHHSTNTLAKVSIFGGIFFLLAVVWAVAEINRSSYNTGQWVERQQPVQFSHKHHSGDDGIDCRYCHTSVEVSSNAGMPATKTCMNCHSQIWSDSPYLEIVRASWKEGKPIEWTKVHDYPTTPTSTTASTSRRASGAHRATGGWTKCRPSIRRRRCRWNGVWRATASRSDTFVQRPDFNMEWNAPNHLGENRTEEQLALGRRLKQEYRVHNAQVLTSCSVCHR